MELLYKINMPLEELNEYEVTFDRYEKILKNVNFGALYKGNNPKMVLKVNEINDKLKQFLNRFGIMTEEEEENEAIDHNIMEKTSNHNDNSNFLDDYLKQSHILNKLKEIERETDQHDDYLENFVSPSLTKMETLFHEIEKKNKVSTVPTGNLSPTLFHKNTNKIEFNPDKFALNLQSTENKLESNKRRNSGKLAFVVSDKAVELEAELAEMDKEEKMLHAYYDSIKQLDFNHEQNHNQREKQDRKKSRNHSAKLDRLVKKRNTQILKNFDKRVSYNANYNVSKNEVKKNELTNLIYINQDKIQSLNHALKSINKEIQQVHDNNEFIQLLKEKSERIVNNEQIDIDKELNTYYYNKSIIFSKEKNRLNSENSRLKTYYQNLRDKAHLVI